MNTQTLEMTNVAELNLPIEIRSNGFAYKLQAYNLGDSVPISEQYFYKVENDYILSETSLSSFEVKLEDTVFKILSVEKARKQIVLLDEADRLSLPEINEKIEDFKDTIRNSVKNKDKMFTNSCILKGEPGSGKSHMTNEVLSKLIEDALIDEYNVIKGKLTPLTVYSQLRNNSESGQVMVLDDCDPWFNNESLNYIKAACETKSAYPRVVTYGSRGDLQQFEFNGFCFFITNFDFEDPNEDQRALLDRVNLLQVNLTKTDVIIKNTSIIEDFLNSNETIEEEILDKIEDFYNTEVKEFLKHDLFGIVGVNFSIRYIMKIADNIMNLGDKWKNSSVEYIRLNAAYQKIIATEAANLKSE